VFDALTAPEPDRINGVKAPQEGLYERSLADPGLAGDKDELTLAVQGFV
jgi:hypothetical protein